jgi:hypothetical protein
MIGGIPFITNGNQFALANVSNLPPLPTKTFDAANKLELVKNSIANKNRIFKAFSYNINHFK